MHGVAGRLFDRRFRAAQVRAKPLRAELVDEFVTVAVARDLVPSRRDLAHELGMALRDPAEHEERRTVSGGVDGVEQPPRRFLDARGQAIPA
jgi:hypothetical protein